MPVEGAINSGEARRLSARGIRRRGDAVEDLKDIIARCGGAVGDAADRLGVTADEVTNTRTGRHAFLDALLLGMYGKGGGHVVDLAGLGLAGHRIAEAAAAALAIGDPVLAAPVAPVAASPPPAPPAGGRGADAASPVTAPDFGDVQAQREARALDKHATTRDAVLARLLALRELHGNWYAVSELTGLSPTTACSLSTGKMRFGERTIAKIMSAPVSDAAAPAGQTPASAGATDREAAALPPAVGEGVEVAPAPLAPPPPAPVADAVAAMPHVGAWPRGAAGVVTTGAPFILMPTREDEGTVEGEIAAEPEGPDDWRSAPLLHLTRQRDRVAALLASAEADLQARLAAVKAEIGDRVVALETEADRIETALRAVRTCAPAPAA